MQPDDMPPDFPFTDADLGVTQEEMDAFYRDMAETPVELPGDEEIADMARRFGLEQPPF